VLLCDRVYSRHCLRFQSQSFFHRRAPINHGISQQQQRRRRRQRRETESQRTQNHTKQPTSERHQKGISHLTAAAQLSESIASKCVLMVRSCIHAAAAAAVCMLMSSSSSTKNITEYNRLGEEDVEERAEKKEKGRSAVLCRDVQQKKRETSVSSSFFLRVVLRSLI